MAATRCMQALKFKPRIRMEKKSDFEDCPTQPSLEFTENGLKNKTYPVNAPTADKSCHYGPNCPEECFQHLVEELRQL